MKMCVTEPDFFWKNPLLAKMNKNDQKWPKMEFFGLFRKIYSNALGQSDFSIL